MPHSNADQFSHVLSVAALNRARSRDFDLVPDAKALAGLRERLGLLGLHKVSLRGTLVPEGKRDWRLQAVLGATGTQPCVVTLAPVTTRIDEPVERVWRAEPSRPVEESDEVEIPEDVSEEVLGREIDLGAVLSEALALALPPWPRAKGARLGEAVYTAPDATPMRDEDARPFAGLKGLRAALGQDPGQDQGKNDDDTDSH